eukprot:scaffold8465_cov60-Phaeocystis_antarctica.AAC.3
MLTASAAFAFHTAFSAIASAGSIGKKSTLLCSPQFVHVTSNRSLSMPSATNAFLQALARISARWSWMDCVDSSLKYATNVLLGRVAESVLPCSLQCSSGNFLSMSATSARVLKFEVAVLRSRDLMLQARFIAMSIAIWACISFFIRARPLPRPFLGVVRGLMLQGSFTFVLAHSNWICRLLSSLLKRMRARAAAFPSQAAFSADAPTGSIRQKSTLLCVPRPAHVTSNRSTGTPSPTNASLQASARPCASASWIDSFDSSLKCAASACSLRSPSPRSAPVLPCSLQCRSGQFSSVSATSLIISEFDVALAGSWDLML